MIWVASAFNTNDIVFVSATDMECNRIACATVDGRVRFFQSHLFFQMKNIRRPSDLSSFLINEASMLTSKSGSRALGLTFIYDVNTDPTTPIPLSSVLDLYSSTKSTMYPITILVAVDIRTLSSGVFHELLLRYKHFGFNGLSINLESALTTSIPGLGYGFVGEEDEAIKIGGSGEGGFAPGLCGPANSAVMRRIVALATRAEYAEREASVMKSDISELKEVISSLKKKLADANEARELAEEEVKKLTEELQNIKHSRDIGDEEKGKDILQDNDDETYKKEEDGVLLDEEKDSNAKLRDTTNNNNKTNQQATESVDNGLEHNSLDNSNSIFDKNLTNSSNITIDKNMPATSSIETSKMESPPQNDSISSRSTNSQESNNCPNQEHKKASHNMIIQPGYNRGKYVGQLNINDNINNNSGQRNTENSNQSTEDTSNVTSAAVSMALGKVATSVNMYAVSNNNDNNNNNSNNSNICNSNDGPDVAGSLNNKDESKLSLLDNGNEGDSTFDDVSYSDELSASDS